MHAMALADPWTEWQRDVVQLIRADFADILHDVNDEDIDWDAWRTFYDQGHTPRDAVNLAFVREVEDDD